LHFYRNTANVDLTLNSVVIQELKHDATNLMLNAGAYQSANPLITSTNSMEFDGTDDFLKVEDSANLRGMAALTVCCWVKINSKSDFAKVLDYSSTSGNSERKYRIQLNNDTDQKIQFLIANTSDSTSIISSTNPVQTDRWLHFVGTFDNSLSANRQSFYIDGVLENTATAFTETINNDNSGFLSFGENTYGSNNFDGQTTEAGIYNRALTSLEVASLYNQGMPTNLLVNRNDYQSGNPTVFNTKQVDFDGADDYAVAGLGSPVVTGSGAITMSVWVITDQANSNFEGAISVGEQGVPKSHYLGRHSSDNWGAGIYGIDMNSGVAPVVNEWTHLVYTYAGGSGGAMKLYVNGVEKATHTGNANVPTSSLSGTYIGSIANNTSFNFNGKISQAGVWNEELTANEVSSLYNHGLPVDLKTDQAAYTSSSNLVGYWRMGSGTLDTYPLIADQTNATLGSELVVIGEWVVVH